ncbi:MAG: conjugal transfer protein TraH, partial [Candidatus Bathyarchaeia archaeon]
SEIMKKVMSIIDALNQIQISECGIIVPKTVVDLVKNPSGFFDLQGEKHVRDQQQKGLSDIWHRFWNKYVRVTDSGTSIDRAGSGTYGLSPVVSAWLNGSENIGLVDFLARQGYVDSEVAKIFKAYVGDLRFTKNEEGSLFNIRVDQACSEAHIKDAFDKGTLYEHTGSRCEPKDANIIINDVQKALQDAYINMLNKRALPDKFVKLAQASPTPLYHIVRYAVLTRNPGFLDSYAPVLAKSIFYAGLLDLSKKMKALFKNMIYYHDVGQNANPLGKELKIALNEGVRELEKRFDEFEDKIVQLYRANQGEVIKAIQEAISVMQFMQLVEKSLNVNLSGMMAYIR